MKKSFKMLKLDPNMSDKEQIHVLLNNQHVLMQNQHQLLDRLDQYNLTLNKLAEYTKVAPPDAGAVLSTILQEGLGET